MDTRDIKEFILQEAMDYYESDREFINFVHLKYLEDLGTWRIELKVWGWLASVWELWEYEGDIFFDLIEG